MQFTDVSDALDADDATSPPPAGSFAFSRQASRQPFSALQVQALPTEATAMATAGDNTRQQAVSPPKHFLKQARSRYVLSTHVAGVCEPTWSYPSRTHSTVAHWGICLCFICMVLCSMKQCCSF